MAIVKVKRKNQSGTTTYVYESLSYWDKEKKQSRSKRKLIGKVDPETGEIVPTGRPGRKNIEDGCNYELLHKMILKKEEADEHFYESKVLEMKKEIANLHLENAKLKRIIDSIKKVLSD